MTKPPTPEFSRPVAIESVADGGVALTVEADAEERARLAERFGLAGIDRLAGEARLVAEPGGVLFRLDGSFAADVVQTCVVTLEALPAHLEESFSRLYSTAAGADDSAAECLDLDADDPPDPLADGFVDVGEAIAEQLALALEPFPRKPGISFTEYSSRTAEGGAGPGTASDGPEAREGPFAALARLRDKLK